MATSNWQHISYCCEALFALGPTSVLDVGMGFGRWGMLTREMCDVWRQRVFPEEWQVQVVGLEAFERLVRDYHRAFYNEIVIGDAADFLEQTDRTFDVAILGDVLEHLGPQQARRVLANARSQAYYTLLAVPLGADWEQGEMYENPYERHRSAWSHGQLAALGPLCHRHFHDFRGRPHGVYVFASTSLDLAYYWRGRRWPLTVPSYPELAALNPQPAAPPRGLRERLRSYFRRHTGQKALLAPLYRVFKRAVRRGRPAAPAAPRRGEAICWEVRREDAPVLAVCPPDWFGVTTSTRNNFPNIVFWQGDEPRAAAEALLERPWEALVFSGLPDSAADLARTLKQRAPERRLLAHYHGSLAQCAQPEIARRFRTLIGLARDGLVDRIGCAKAGMAQVLRSNGVEAVYLPYRIEPPEQVRSGPAGSPRRVGVFMRDILRKNAHTQFAAAAMLDNVEVHVNALADLFYLPPGVRIVEHGDLPYEEFLELLATMDLTLYVSLSECYPMVVAESLIRGVPCVTSHTHEILEHDADLARSLLVEALDNPAAIAECAEAALAERDALGRRCAAYALELNGRAEAALNEFVGCTIWPD